MSETGRIARFVKAARALLLMQLFAALLASALAVWAVTAVWALAAERDQLREQLDLVQSRPAAAEAELPAENPMSNEPRPPATIPIVIPIPQAPMDVNMMLPDTPAVPPVTNQAAEPVPETPPAAADCAADPTQPRCRSERWRPPVRQRPIPRVEPEPQQPTAEPAPRPN